MLVPFESDAARWTAVLDRDPAADGVFFYGVASTGIFCRPVCPSRRPRRGNVVFFDTAAQAVAAGYRACLRCRPETPGPETPGPETPGDARLATVTAACRCLDEAEEEPSLAALAEAAGMSPWHFQKVFRAVTGLSPKAYGRAVRARRLRAALAAGHSVTAAIYEAGFASASRAYAQAAGHLGMTPGAFGRGGAGQTIRHAVVPCPLGWLMVAGTQRGLCAIEFADAPDDARAALAARFPAATLEPADDAFADWLGVVVALVEDPSRGAADLPLDIRATAFQARVWEALRAIPPGTTVTYAELAARIGHPGAARAVGAACGANRLAVAVPCHRVVRGDGGLAGFAWGEERKRTLLEREGKGTV